MLRLDNAVYFERSQSELSDGIWDDALVTKDPVGYLEDWMTWRKHSIGLFLSLSSTMLFKHFLKARYAVPFFSVLSKTMQTTTTFLGLLNLTQIGRGIVV